MPADHHPLHAGHPAVTGRQGLVAAGARRQGAAVVRRPPGLPRRGPARLRVRPSFPEGLPGGAAAGPGACLRGRRPLRAGRQARRAGAGNPRVPRQQPDLRGVPTNGRHPPDQ
ncbi:hypothetical protein G6F60_015095 [Rhizopus arrhizus]|nr:hypothetical protein G6F60_015095 [Rhizopus arrhizus]